LVANQLAGATTAGATVRRDTVVGIEATAGGVEVRTRAGDTVAAERVLVAAGAYVNSFGFFVEPLPVVSTGITALFFEVDDAAAEALDGMPGILWYPAGGRAHFLYTVPPTRYPDGKVYFKIGGYRESGPLHSEAEITRWHRTDGGHLEADMLRAWVGAHVPVLAGRDTHAVGCVVTDTASTFPMLREVVPGRVSVATGCAGAAAKSCDEIGRLAALVAVGAAWDSPLPQALFQG
jgi:sarcosine oxidase